MAIRNTLTCTLPDQKKTIRKKAKVNKTWCLCRATLGSCDANLIQSQYWSNILQINLKPYVYQKSTNSEKLGRSRNWSTQTMAEFPYAASYFWKIYSDIVALYPKTRVTDYAA